MRNKFAYEDKVRVAVQPPRIRDQLVGKIGEISGMSDPYPNNHRDYCVYIDDLKEAFAIPEDLLEKVDR